MKDYHNLYNLSNVLLLADVFENFRNICMNHYGLNSAWYFSAPGLDTALKITKVQLELLSYLDMLLMIESGIRGEIATISHGHAKANNEYMGIEFDPVKESKFISYLDANNLCQPSQQPSIDYYHIDSNYLYCFVICFELH